jgi:hypothetical protein
MLHMSIATTRTAFRHAADSPASQYAVSSAVRPSTCPSSPCSPDRSKKHVCHLSAAAALSIPAVGCAIIAFGVVAYVLDDGDLRAVLAWIRRVVKRRS